MALYNTAPQPTAQLQSEGTFMFQGLGQLRPWDSQAGLSKEVSPKEGGRVADWFLREPAGFPLKSVQDMDRLCDTKPELVLVAVPCQAGSWLK